MCSICSHSSDSDSSVKKFIEQTTKLTPGERAALLEKDEVRKPKIRTVLDGVLC